MINVKHDYNPYYAAYAAYATVTPEDYRSNVDYMAWISSKWDTWRKETKHSGGIEDKDREAFLAWLRINCEA